MESLGVFLDCCACHAGGEHSGGNHGSIHRPILVFLGRFFRGSRIVGQSLVLQAGHPKLPKCQQLSGKTQISSRFQLA